MKNPLPFLKPPELIGMATLNEKSQIVIPKEARERLGMQPGDKLMLAIAPFGNALILAKPDDVEKHLNSFLSTAQDNLNDFKKSVEDKSS